MFYQEALAFISNEKLGVILIGLSLCVTWPFSSAAYLGLSDGGSSFGLYPAELSGPGLLQQQSLAWTLFCGGHWFSPTAEEVTGLGLVPQRTLIQACSFGGHFLLPVPLEVADLCIFLMVDYSRKNWKVCTITEIHWFFVCYQIQNVVLKPQYTSWLQTQKTA